MEVLAGHVLEFLGHGLAPRAVGPPRAGMGDWVNSNDLTSRPTPGNHGFIMVDLGKSCTFQAVIIQVSEIF